MNCIILLRWIQCNLILIYTMNQKIGQLEEFYVQFWKSDFSLNVLRSFQCKHFWSLSPTLLFYMENYVNFYFNLKVDLYWNIFNGFYSFEHPKNFKKSSMQRNPCMNLMYFVNSFLWTKNLLSVHLPIQNDSSCSLIKKNWNGKSSCDFEIRIQH